MGATSIYELCEEIIEKLKYTGTYQYYVLMIFWDHRSIKQTISWLCNFQLKVGEVVGGSFFQFTAELWKLPGDVKIPIVKEEKEIEGVLVDKWAQWTEQVMVVMEKEFLYLDMKMSWKDGDM
eukprot:10943434-Ditylum_brightwellii.AAC.1